MATPELAALEEEIKVLMIDALALEDVSAGDIESEQPLLTVGLGLDSIDILELIMALRREYGVEFREDPEEIRAYFSSIRALATFVMEHRTKS